MSVAALKRLFALLTVLCVAPLAFGQTASGTVDWVYTAPTQFTDGTAIPSTDMIAFNLYAGTAGPGSEAATPVQAGIRYLSAVTSGYTAGENICGFVTAVVNGVESPHSSEACATFTGTPAAPSNLTIKVNP